MPDKTEWLRDFVSLTKDTEVPEMFAMWTGASTLALCLGRRVWIDMGVYKVYPNMLVVLVAGSGRCRKSTAIGVMENLIYSLKPRPKIISQKITPEALIEAMVEQPKDSAHVLSETCEGYVVVDELSNFLNRKTYEAGLASLLISLYDCKDLFEYRTKGRGVEKITNSCIGLLGGSTIEWIQDAIPVGAVGGGLTSRIIFVYQREPGKPKAWTEVTPEVIETKKRLVQGLQRIRRLAGPAVLTSDAREYYEEEYNHFYKHKFFDNRYLAGYASRRHVHMLKLGLSLSASVCTGGKLIIEYGHLHAATGLLEACEAHMEDVLRLITATEGGSLIKLVEQRIRKARKIKRSALMRTLSNRISARDLDEIIRTLMSSNAITETSDGKSTWYLAT